VRVGFVSEALSKLLGGWVTAPDGEMVLTVGSDPAVLENSRTFMREYLQAYESFDAQGAALAQQN